MGIALRSRVATRRSATRARDRAGDVVLAALCGGAALLAAGVMVDIAYTVLSRSRPAFSAFGSAFVSGTEWKPNFNRFGAADLIYGTAVTSAMALAIAVPLAVAIGLFLSQLAPPRLRAVIGPLVEMLAAIPSVILGFWGLVVLAPAVRDAEPWLHRTFGFLGLFGEPQATGAGVFLAGLILTIMVLPIVASISRDLFLTVPRELQEGALALGATRWEMVRGVVLPATFTGVASAAFLGLGRALGEAIAVAQVIGAHDAAPHSLFDTGDTLASRIALQFPGAFTKLHFSALYGCAAILLVTGLASNLLAQWIGRRFGPARKLAR